MSTRRAPSRAAADLDAPGKRPFDIDQVVARVREAVRPFPKAAMFALADDAVSQ